MNSQPHILVISKDPALMYTRKLVLGTYFAVTTAGTVSEAVNLLGGRDFDLVVFCETLTGYERSELGRLAENKLPRPTVLTLLRRGAEHQEAIVGEPMMCTRGPLELLKKCADTLGVVLSLHQRGQRPHPILQQF